ncbi:MAG: LCP family protein [Fibrobacterota bacterium]
MRKKRRIPPPWEWMESQHEKKQNLLVIGGFVVLGVALLFYNFRDLSPTKRELSVMIEGQVKRPGMYYVPEGATTFDVLKIAGVLPNSDLNDVDVNEAVSEGDTVIVRKLGKDVTLKSGALPFFGQACAVNFVTGKVSVVPLKGPSRTPVRNTPLIEGDKVLTGPDGMVEIRLGDGTLMDVQSNSELRIKSLYPADSSGTLTVTMDLAAGSLWSYVKTPPPNVFFQFTTPHLAAEIRGGEVELFADNDQSRLHVIKGMVFVGKHNETNRTNISEGQKITIHAAADTPVESGNLTDEEKKGDPNLKSFSEKRDKFLARNAIRRVLILGLPDYYCLYEMDPLARQIKMYRIPANTPVNDYVEGVNELSKVYLYGGIGLTTSLVERVTERSIEHFITFGRKDIEILVNRLGGVFLDVDDMSASDMGVKPGYQKLNGLMLLKYMSPKRDDREKGIDRQNRAMYALYDATVKKRLVFSVPLFTKLFASTETDVNVSFAMDSYNTFTSGADWKMDFVFLGAQDAPKEAPATPKQ